MKKFYMEFMPAMTSDELQNEISHLLTIIESFGAKTTNNNNNNNNVDIRMDGLSIDDDKM